MTCRQAELAALLTLEQFPRSAAYDPEWVIENRMGPNVLWLTEALSQVMTLQPGMRVLDMGCGKALSSIFLAKEFGVQMGLSSNQEEADMLRTDARRNVGLTRMVARKM